jgi:hypothetical protein
VDAIPIKAAYFVAYVTPFGVTPLVVSRQEAIKMLMELKGKIERFLRTVLFSRLLAIDCAHSRTVG